MFISNEYITNTVKKSKIKANCFWGVAVINLTEGGSLLE